MPTLLRIAPELRNKIYEFVFEHDPRPAVFQMRCGSCVGLPRRRTDSCVPPGTVNIRSTPPGITQVCKQTRNEAQRMYLASTNFAANVKEMIYASTSETGYDYLPKILTVLGKKNVEAIKSIMIICNDPFGEGVFDTRDRKVATLSLTVTWDRFVPGLLKAGLRSHQFRWPAPGPELHSFRQHPMAHDVERLAVLYKGIILPTLTKYGCIVPSSCPLRNVMEELAALPGHSGSAHRRHVATRVRSLDRRRKYLEIWSDFGAKMVLLRLLSPVDPMLQAQQLSADGQDCKSMVNLQQ